jgi:hypothetical protein
MRGPKAYVVDDVDTASTVVVAFPSATTTDIAKILGASMRSF